MNAIVSLADSARYARCIEASKAVRWDIERGRTVRVLQADLQMAQARERCWEALARYTPRTADDVIAPGKRDAWIGRCLNTELSRVNAKR